MVDRVMEFRIHRDVNEEVMGVARFGQSSFPFQRQWPIWDANLTEREVLHKGDVGMRVLERIDGQEQRTRLPLCES